MTKKVKLRRSKAGKYQTTVLGKEIEIWQCYYSKYWFTSLNPHAYFETLTGIRKYLNQLENGEVTLDDV